MTNQVQEFRYANGRAYTLAMLAVLWTADALLRFHWHGDKVALAINLLLALFAGWAALRFRGTYVQVSDSQLVLKPVLGAALSIPWSSVKTAQRVRKTIVEMALSDGGTAKLDLALVAPERREALVAELRRHLSGLGVSFESPAGVSL